MFPQIRIDYGPMNSQEGRQRLVVALLETASPAAVLETGTYLGTTSRFLAEHTQAPIFSTEVNPEFHRDARETLEGLSNVHLKLADSRAALREWTADGAVPKSGVLFYLDAHWHDDLPLAEELTIITQSWTDSLILIDDFEVPGDPDYMFDDYGPGKRLCLAIIPAGIRDSWTPLFPALPGREETGARKGCVLLAPPERAAQLCDSLPLRAGSWQAIA